MMEQNSRILVTGCQGMTGWALVRELQRTGYTNVVAVDRSDCDLCNTEKVQNLFKKEQPEFVFHVAAKVGGIYANDSQSADFIYENLMMQSNVIHTAKVYGVKKLLFCGSACIYPKNAEQPIKESTLLTGVLEETNKAYAVAKIAGVTMTQMYRKQYGCNFISAMPTNLYGIGDNFNLEHSHVLPALMRKIHDAKLSNSPFVEIWGTGEPRREFLYIDDLAKGLIFLMQNYDGAEHINIGTGQDVEIRELVQILTEVIGYHGEIRWTGALNGVFQRRLNVSKINNLGWSAKTSLVEGVKKTYQWYVNSFEMVRK
jgi:GDP-L-fucose synthase